jgi:hypothetical protein
LGGGDFHRAGDAGVGEEGPGFAILDHIGDLVAGQAS